MHLLYFIIYGLVKQQLMNASKYLSFSMHIIELLTFNDTLW